MEDYIDSARRQLRNESEYIVFDSKAEINRVNALLRTKAEETKVKVRLKLVEKAKIYGDSARFSQVIANLLVNSIESYETEEGLREKIRIVHINSFVRNNKTFELSVKDSGVGIRKNEIEKIFEPFYTSKSMQRGTGIGLTIIKRIIEEEFHGEIIVESEAKKGATFRVVIPLFNEMSNA